MSAGWTPSLTVREVGRRCRLSLDGVAWGDGDTLQEAADDLLARLRAIAFTLRSNGWNVPSAFGPPDVRVLSFLCELGELAARSDDIRDRVLGFAGDRV
jgi:hypothetical protein